MPREIMEGTHDEITIDTPQAGSGESRSLDPIVPPTETSQTEFNQRLEGQILTDPVTGKELRPMGGGAEPPVLTPEEDAKERAKARIYAEEAQRVANLNRFQQNNRPELAASLAQRVGDGSQPGDLSSAELQRLINTQENTERTAISMMHKVSIWLTEDEVAVRTRYIEEIRNANPKLTKDQVLQMASQRPIDSHYFTIIRERAEEVVRLIEQNPELEFRSGAIQGLHGAIEDGASQYPELVYEIKNMIESRSLDRGAFLAAKYKGGKDWGGAVASFLPEYHSAFYSPGVQATSAILKEATDENNHEQTIGQYFRELLWRPEYDEAGEEIKGSRKLLKSGEANSTGVGARDYKLTYEDLQAELKIRSVRMKKDIDETDNRLSEIVKRNKGGAGLSKSRVGDDILAYAFTQIQDSLEGKEGKTLLRAEDIADQLMATNKEGEIIGVSPKEGRFKDEQLRITTLKQREDFIKAVSFASRAYDISYQKAVFAGLALDAKGPVLKYSKHKSKINGVEYDLLALPDHVWLTIPDRIDAGILLKGSQTSVEDLTKQIDKINANKYLDVVKKRRRIAELTEQREKILELRTKWGLEDTDLSDDQKNERDKRIFKELFGGLEGTKVDLRNLHNLTDSQNLLLDKVRKGAGFLIPMAWDLSFRKYFHDHMDDIDADKSNVRGVAREVGGLMWLNVYLSQNAHRNPGEAEELRKEIFPGLLSIRRTAARDGVDDVIDNWNRDYSLSARHLSDRAVGAAAIKSPFYEGEHHLLSNFAAIQDITKFIGVFQEQMREYMYIDELKEVKASWVKVLMHFNINSLTKYGFRQNWIMEEAYAKLAELIQNRTANFATSEQIKDAEYGPKLWREPVFLWRHADKVGAIWEFLTGFLKLIMPQTR